MVSYHPNDPLMIANYFDPNNKKHLKAFRELEQIGHWPKWFWDEASKQGVKIHSGWEMLITSKLAEKWMNYKLGKERKHPPRHSENQELCPTCGIAECIHTKFIGTAGIAQNESEG